MSAVDLGLHEKLGAHDKALENGQRAFDSVRKEIAALDVRVKEMEPKRVNWLQLAGFGLALVLALLTAWWKLSAMFQERPTRAELGVQQAEQMLLQQQQAAEIRQIRDRQIEQGVYLQQLLKLDKAAP